MSKLEAAYERINQLEDLLSDTLCHLLGERGYENRQAMIDDLQAYFEARKSFRDGQSEQK